MIFNGALLPSWNSYTVEFPQFLRPGQGHHSSLPSNSRVEFRQAASSLVKFCQVQRLTTQRNVLRHQRFGSRQGPPRPVASSSRRNGGDRKARTHIGRLFEVAAGHRKRIPQILIIRKPLLRPERRRRRSASGPQPMSTLSPNLRVSRERSSPEDKKWN